MLWRIGNHSVVERRSPRCVLLQRIQSTYRARRADNPDGTSSNVGSSLGLRCTSEIPAAQIHRPPPPGRGPQPPRRARPRLPVHDQSTNHRYTRGHGWHTPTHQRGPSSPPRDDARSHAVPHTTRGLARPARGRSSTIARCCVRFRSNTQEGARERGASDGEGTKARSCEHPLRTREFRPGRGRNSQGAAIIACAVLCLRSVISALLLVREASVTFVLVAPKARSRCRHPHGRCRARALLVRNHVGFLSTITREQQKGDATLYSSG